MKCPEVRELERYADGELDPVLARFAEEGILSDIVYSVVGL